ncbi:hypothetical protein [Roseovarius amoyensis]|uniref:hypothetical protein n=1 Tax=Roseovarius amoyensis TaxID=2211448 RepID=UPI000DBE1122|nr:hypothetical protein [Roseovarius amoyensis]
MTFLSTPGRSDRGRDLFKDRPKKEVKEHAHARRAEVDAEAVLEVPGYMCRPGPKEQVAPKIMEAIVVAIKAPFSLVLTAGPASPREQVVQGCLRS